jgi:hypothetical protein
MGACPASEKLAQWYETLGFARGSACTKDKTKRLVMYGPLKIFLPDLDQVC